MVSSAELRPTDLVVEIGPGAGAITRVLAKEAGDVMAYEIDKDLVKALSEELHWAHNVQVMEQNILNRNFSLPRQNYKVVASLPYYITSPVLEKLLTSETVASIIILMVQREVAEKIMGTPPDSSYLANFVRLFGEPQIISHVSPAAFHPRPQVESSILKITTHPAPLIPKAEAEQMMSLLHAGFTEPRKQLHNSLAAGLGLNATEAKNLLQLANIDSERRAETLSLPEWLRLYEVIKNA
jgi:16S rRNA (adenine1518-N6/adenine1519-N6)-dimethyltransferase